jgi:hypothetical protein
MIRATPGIYRLSVFVEVMSKKIGVCPYYYLGIMIKRKANISFSKKMNIVRHRKLNRKC